MTTSRRLADRKVERFDKNIVRRGSVPETSAKKGKSYPVGPVMLGFFVFVVIGSYNQDSYKWGHGLIAASGFNTILFNRPITIEPDGTIHQISSIVANGV